MYFFLATPYYWDFPEQRVPTAYEKKKDRILLIGRIPGFVFYPSGKVKGRIHSK